MSQKPLILVIDDTADFREIFSIKLEAAGFEVVTAANGEEGLKVLQSKKPDLVLLDMEMPVMNGIETITRIKQNPEMKHLNVAFLTSYGEPQENQAWLDNKFAEEVGAIDYIRKTDDFERIITHIKTYINANPTPNSGR